MSRLRFKMRAEESSSSPSLFQLSFLETPLRPTTGWCSASRPSSLFSSLLPEPPDLEPVPRGSALLLAEPPDLEPLSAETTRPALHQLWSDMSEKQEEEEEEYKEEEKGKEEIELVESPSKRPKTATSLQMRQSAADVIATAAAKKLQKPDGGKRKRGRPRKVVPDVTNNNLDDDLVPYEMGNAKMLDEVDEDDDDHKWNRSVLIDWLNKNNGLVYSPSVGEKATLALAAGMTEKQVEKFMWNHRKRQREQERLHGKKSPTREKSIRPDGES